MGAPQWDRCAARISKFICMRLWPTALMVFILIWGTSCMRFGLGHFDDDGSDVTEAGVDASVDSDTPLDGDATGEADVDVPIEPLGCANPIVSEAVSVVGEPSPGSELAIAVLGGGLAMAWVGDVDGTEEVFFMVVNADGTPLVSPIQASPDDGAASWAPAVEVLGDGYAVAYADARGEQPQAYLRVIDDNGVGLETRLPEVETYDDHWSVDLAQGTEGLGATWHDGHDVFFVAVEDDGSRAGSVTQVTNDPWILEPLEMAYGAGAYSIVWSDYRDDYEVLYGRVTAAGEKLVAPLPIASAPGESYSPSLCFDGVSFIFLWIDDREGSDALTIARLDPDGSILEGPIVVAGGHTPDIARIFCTGLDYGVAWLEGGALYFGTLGDDFELQAPEALVSTPEEVVDAFSIVWDGQEYTVATIEEDDGLPDTSPLSVRMITCDP